MVHIRHVAVIDIGKTNAKLATVDLETRTESDAQKTANVVVGGDPYPYFGIERLWGFILHGLTELRRAGPVDAISVTTHGATAALLDAGGALALPVLDYEHPGPDSLRERYERVRPPFSETGTPRLAGGLNLGAQLYWQQHAFPEAFKRVALVLTYPQYWSYKLTGVAATEVSSLGCHTDLWNPAGRSFSSMVDTLEWRKLFARRYKASDCLGSITREIASSTGLPPNTPVFCGIHDSNASLLPHLLGRKPPFSVVSTGTWVIAMNVGAKAGHLDPARDTLINVNALGDPVPSARFMGGRENAILTEGLADQWSEAELADVLQTRLMLLPSVLTDCGPFPRQKGYWLPARPIHSGPLRIASSLYLAMMTATCLALTGADGSIIIEGPFATNTVFTRMLTAATGRHVYADARTATGTGIGAAMLALDAPPSRAWHGMPVPPPGKLWTAYAETWTERAVAARP